MKQHKMLLALAALYLLCMNLSAQVSIGARAGYFYHNLTISPRAEGTEKPKPVTGLQFALPIEIELSNHWSLQAEVMYGKHGSKRFDTEEITINGTLVTGEVTQIHSFHSLEFPVLAKWKFGKERKFYLLAGPSVDFFLDGKYTVDGIIYVATPKGGFERVPIQESYKAYFTKKNYDDTQVPDGEFGSAKTSINVHSGAGVSTQIGPINLFLELRYIATLTDLDPEARAPQHTNDYTVKSHRWGASAGIMVPLKW